VNPLACAAFRHTIEVAMIAGCELMVLDSSSRVALKQIFLRSEPSISEPVSYTSMSSGIASAMSFPMPSYCEPCPENSAIVIINNFLSVCYLQSIGENILLPDCKFVRNDDILSLKYQSAEISLQKTSK
jgi:hypothetical protein